ncbi:hypothetical protein ACGFNU_17840 [Spirillospora sp. NPDC048911]|uniref:hypothetical protein n=1 Tax=Spirillospora sp. NPDC048911 TaxID=3364527 RepID=UPI0037203DB4
MRAELDKLRSGSAGHAGNVGTVGAWDVPEQLSERVGTAHQSMLRYVTLFAKAYEDVIASIESSAKNFDLSDLAARDAASRAGRGIEPRATHESQN